MATRDVCFYRVDELHTANLADFSIVARTSTRKDLRQAVGTLRPALIVVDLDAADAMDAIVDAREIDLSIGIVGVTGQSDPKLMVSAVRVGCTQLTTKPIDENDLVVAMRRALGESGSGVGGRTVAVIGSVGGAGATTIASYLGLGLAECTGAKSLVVDIDFDFGGVARAWDLAPQHTIGDVAGAGTVDSLMIERAAAEMCGGVYVLSRPNTIEEGHTIDETMIGQILDVSRKAFPYVVLDLPRKLDSVTGCALERCDRLVVVMQLSVPSVENTRRLMDALMRLGMPSERIELIVNRHRKNMHTVTVEMIEKELRREVFGIVPNDFRSLASSIDVGQPVEAKNPVRASITDMARRLIGQSGRSKSSGGWLSKIGLSRGKAGISASAEPVKSS